MREDGKAEMRKAIITFAVIGTIIAQSYAAQPDAQLKNRENLVAAVALLLQVLPTCRGGINTPPSDEAIAAFIVLHGHTPNKAFFDDVKIQMARNAETDRLRPEPERSEHHALLCAYCFELRGMALDAQ